MLQKLGTIVNKFRRGKVERLSSTEGCSACRKDGNDCYSWGYSCVYCNITKNNCDLNKFKIKKEEDEEAKMSEMSKKDKKDKGKAKAQPKQPAPAASEADTNTHGDEDDGIEFIGMQSAIWASTALASAKLIDTTTEDVLKKVKHFVKEHLPGIEGQLLNAHLSPLSIVIAEAKKVIEQHEAQLAPVADDVQVKTENKTSGSTFPFETPNTYQRFLGDLERRYPGGPSPGSDPFYNGATAGPGPSTQAKKRKRDGKERVNELVPRKKSG